MRMEDASFYWQPRCGTRAAAGSESNPFSSHEVNVAKPFMRSDALEPSLSGVKD